MGIFFQVFCLFQHISFDLSSLSSAEGYTGWGRKLNDHLMASCVRNIPTKSYQNLIIDFQVTVENVGDAFLGHSGKQLNYTDPQIG